MNIKKRLEKFGITSVYHFTDESNLESIEKFGIQSLYNIEQQNIDVSRFGANELSHDLDVRSGLDRYVHLSFIKDHPMYHNAKSRGSILKPVWLELDISILFEDETLFCDEVANSSRAVLFRVDNILNSINFNGMINERDFWIKKEIRKAEILAYNNVSTDKILGVTYGK